MQTFIDQLANLSKDVKQLRDEDSDDEELSLESSKEEPCQKKSRPSTSTPKAQPQKKNRKKVSSLTVKLPPLAQIDMTQVNNDYIKR